jgi:ferredoxin-NADP reductase
MAVEYTAELVRSVEQGADTRSLHLRQTTGPRIAFRPGQFISCLLPIGGETLIRPYSLTSDPEDEDLEICLNLVPGGRGSRYLLGLPVGATVRFTGPWGTFTLDQAPEGEVVFIADGTGIAPIRPMLHRALATTPRHSIRLLCGIWPDSGLPYHAELVVLAREHSALDFDAVPSTALRDEVRRRWVDGDVERRRSFYICGVGQLVPELRDLLRRTGYERRAVQYEKW